MRSNFKVVFVEKSNCESRKQCIRPTKKKAPTRKHAFQTHTKYIIIIVLFLLMMKFYYQISKKFKLLFQFKLCYKNFEKLYNKFH